MTVKWYARLARGFEIKIKSDLVSIIDLSGRKAAFNFETSSGPLLKSLSELESGRLSLGKTKGALFQQLCLQGALEQVLVSDRPIASYNMSLDTSHTSRGDLSPWSYVRFEPEPVLSCAKSTASFRFDDPSAFSAIFEKQSSPFTRQIFKALGSLGLLTKEPHHTLSTSEFHDVLFHTRTRVQGRERFIRDSYSRAPASTVVDGKKKLTLYRKLPAAQIDRLKRASYRAHSNEPLSLQNLANLLATIDPNTHSYPSAGGFYENELYVLANQISGLKFGLYLYREGQLFKTSATSKHLRALLQQASLSWGQTNGEPQGLIIVSSCLPKLTQKYTQIAYRLSLMNAGIIMGLLDRAANELGLAGCCLGTGSSRIFEEAIASQNNDTSLAEFAFGRRASPAGKRQSRETL